MEKKRAVHKRDIRLTKRGSFTQRFLHGDRCIEKHTYEGNCFNILDKLQCFWRYKNDLMPSNEMRI